MKALVLSGGSALGAYQVGVLKYVARNTATMFNSVYGVSVGAINGGKLVMYHKTKLLDAVIELEKMWLRLGKNGVYKRHFPFGKLHLLGGRCSLFDVSPLRKLVRDTFDASKVGSNGYNFAVGAVSWNTGEFRLVKHTHPRIEDFIMASAAQPIAFPPVCIEGEWWLDGGLRDATPILSAIAEGADEALVILTEAPKVRRIDQAPAHGLAVGERALGLLAHEVFRNDIELALTKGVKVTMVRPGSPLAADPLDFGKDQVQRLIQLGYSDAAATLPGTKT